MTAAGGRPFSPRASRPANDFPLNNFKHFLTLFSKFFSSFPHGTCSLSVSRQYLALDGTYHQLRAAFPNNPTLRSRSRGTAGTTRRGSHPLRRPLPRHLGSRCDREQFYTLQFATEWRFSRWALPVSLAVTRGILVSFFSSAY